MKFTGQIKIPDLDHPGVPAVVLIEENQTELLMQGESLGRWSLVDVRADRLIASAFSLALGNEEVTFIADEPVDFAYRGVEQMANVWARYRTMTLPRRFVANKLSRSGTKPSRIAELRSAMIDNLESAEASAASFDGATKERPPARPQPPAYQPAPPARAPEEPAPLVGDSPSEPPPLEPGVSPQPAEPGPAEIDRPAAHSDSAPKPDAEFEEPAARSPETPIESVFKESVPWLKPQRPDVEEPAEPTPVAPPPASPEDIFARDEAPVVSAHDEPTPGEITSEPEDAESDVPPPAPTPETRRRYVVDLGAFEDSDEEPRDARAPSAPEPALAGAPEKGGIMGAVRAAFVRGRPDHDHEYVEAPGGIGIIRHICTECGHISIGTSD